MSPWSVFTCLTCRVAFADADIQRAHYKTDWHRYNLKRKVADLPAVTAENFAERSKAQKEQEAVVKAGTSGHCNVCNKHFNSNNAYENHVKSKKHMEIEAKHQKLRARKEELQQKQAGDCAAIVEKNLRIAMIEEESAKEVQGKGDGHVQAAVATVEDDDNKSVESWGGDAIGIEECFFCSHVSRNMGKNVNHMTTVHSFFIPDLEYLVDLEGLITYLGEKVGEGHICLWCNEKGKSYNTTTSVQQHMRDKGHCKMLFEGDTVFEYSDFYDYRKSYPDFEAGAEKMEKEPAEEMEVEIEAIEEDNYQLVLPSGSTLGHRSLQRYYRQKLRPDRPHHLTPVNKLMSQYRALGWTGTTGVVAQLRAKDIAYVQRQKQKHQMRLCCKANKLNGRLRPQVVF